MKEGVDSIKEALEEAGFDWGTGKVYLPGNPGVREVRHDDPGLDERGNYFAVDENFGYMSCVMTFFGRPGIFPGKVRKDSVQAIEVNLDSFFGNGNNPVVDTVKSILSGMEILSAVDVQGEVKGLDLHIVGSKDVPFFVVALSEEEAIKMFFGRFVNSAREAFRVQALERLMLLAALTGEKCGDPDCPNCNPGTEPEPEQ